MTYPLAIYRRPWRVKKTGVLVPGRWPSRVRPFAGAELVRLLTTFAVLPKLQWVCSVKSCTGNRPGVQPERPCPLCGSRMVRNKLAVPMWAPHTLEPVHRLKENVTEVSCLVYDYDDGATIESAHAAWQGYHHIVHTSWSHTPEAPRFRLVLPLTAPIPRRWFERAWHFGARRGQVDGQAKDPSRVYALPAVRSADWPRYAKVHRGAEQLDLRPFEDLPPTPAEERAERARMRARQARRAVCYSHDEAMDEATRRFRRDPEARLRAAQLLGMHIEGEYARGGVCPVHGPGLVYFRIDPAGHSPRAWCGHKHTCDYGREGVHVDQLLREQA